METLGDIAAKGGLTVDSGGSATVPAGPASTTLLQAMNAPGSSQNPSGGVQLSPAVSAAASKAGATVGPSGTVTVPPAPAIQGPVKPPAPPPPFKATVPPTMDATALAGAVSNPATLPPVPSSTDTTVYQMADGRYYNPSTGVSAATRDQALTPPPAPTPSSASGTTSADNTAGNAGATTPPVNDNVTAAIKALYPNSDSLVKQYQDARDAAGLPKMEADLQDVNTQIANMNSTIANIENDVRQQSGGMANESFIQATVADRIRRLQPIIDSLNARQQALTANIDVVKGNVTQQLGLSQQDITNAVTQQNQVRSGIKDLLSTYGSAAFANVDPAILSELEKRAGLPPGTINAQIKTLPEKQQAQSSTEFQVVNDRIYKVDKATGTVTDMGITVPISKKDQITQAIQEANIIGQTALNPDAALQFLQSYIPGIGSSPGGMSGSVVTASPTATVSSLDDNNLAGVIAAMAAREGFGADPNNRPTRNNNPGDIKVPAGGIAQAQQQYGDPGATIDPVPATDGGQFIKFSTPEAGFRAMGTLLQSPTYANLSLDAAMKKWSGNGYGAEIFGGQGQGTTGTGSGTGIGGIETGIPGLKGDAVTYVMNGLASPNLTPSDRTSLKRAVASAAESKDPVAINDQIRSMAYQAMTQSQKNDSSSFQSALNLTGGILTDLSQFQKTNPGIWTTAIQNGKTLIQQPKNKAWLDLMSRIESNQAEIRRSIFGTALTGTEKASADNLFVNPNDTLPDIQTKLKNLDAFMSSKYNTPINNTLGIFGPQASNFLVVAPDGSSQFFPTQDQAQAFIDKIKGK